MAIEEVSIRLALVAKFFQSTQKTKAQLGRIDGPYFDGCLRRSDFTSAQFGSFHIKSFSNTEALGSHQGRG